MEEKINIDKILKDKPEKTILYDAMRDINVSLYVVEKRNGETNIFCDGMEKFKGCNFVYFGKSFLKRMDGHVIALKENVLGISGTNTKTALSLCDIIIFWEFTLYLSMTEKTMLL